MKVLAKIFYYYLWVVLNIFLGYFYRFNRVKHTTGFENIPHEKPIMFSSNHPNAFMDALMLGVTNNRPTWSLARGDAFNNKALAKFFGFLGIIPIYRLQEGSENLGRNDRTFERCAELLAEKKPIMIFSEGLCVQERRLRKLKKGTARIAFGAEEKNNFKLDLMIVPVGLNYSSTPWKFRSTLHVRFGKPMAMKDYHELYLKDKARAMSMFTRELEARMAEEVIIIDDKANDTLVAQLEEMITKSQAKKNNLDPRNQKETHFITMGITNFLKEGEKESSMRITSLRETVAEYFKNLKSKNVRDWVIQRSNDGNLSVSGILFNYFLFLIFSPIWIFGLITNYVPYKVPSIVAGKVVKNIEWHASVNAAMAVFLWQFYWLLQSLIVALVFRNWYLLFGFMLLVPITGALAQELYVLLKKTNGARRFIFWKSKNEKEELQLKRKEIIAEVDLLLKEFPLKITSPKN